MTSTSVMAAGSSSRLDQRLDLQPWQGTTALLRCLGTSLTARPRTNQVSIGRFCVQVPPALSLSLLPCRLLQRVSIACYAERCISYDRFCLTDRLSVTRWYHAKTTPATIMQSSREDSPMTLVSSRLDFTAKFQGEHRERGRRMREG